MLWKCISSWLVFHTIPPYYAPVCIDTEIECIVTWRYSLYVFTQTKDEHVNVHIIYI